MRLLAVSMLLILAEASAAACPAGTACVAAETRSSSSKEPENELARTEVSAVHSRTLLAHAFARLGDGHTPLSHSLREHVVPQRIEMPSMWQTLRTNVYAQLPHYDHGNRSLTLSPVLVDGPADSVPGLGLAGSF